MHHFFLILSLEIVLVHTALGVLLRPQNYDLAQSALHVVAQNQNHGQAKTPFPFVPSWPLGFVLVQCCHGGAKSVSFGLDRLWRFRGFGTFAVESRLT